MTALQGFAPTINRKLIGPLPTTASSWCRYLAAFGRSSWCPNPVHRHTDAQHARSRYLRLFAAAWRVVLLTPVRRPNASDAFNTSLPPATHDRRSTFSRVSLLPPLFSAHHFCGDNGSNGISGIAPAMAYIVVVAESVTTQYFTTLTDSDLLADDPPPVCLAPSTGRFEVNTRGHDESRGGGGGRRRVVWRRQSYARSWWAT